MSLPVLQTPARVQLEKALVQKCWKDPAFLKQVMGDPKGVIEQYTGRALPRQLNIFIHVHDADTLHFIIPPLPTNFGDLSDDDLETVAGGTEMALAFVFGIFSLGVTTAGTAAVSPIRKESSSTW